MKKRTDIIALFADGTEPPGESFEEFVNSARHVWEDSLLNGEAVPATVPDVDRQTFYVAKTAGTYTAFTDETDTALTLASGEVAFLYLTIDQDNPADYYWSKISVMVSGSYTQNYHATFEDTDVVDGILPITYVAKSLTRPLIAVISPAGGASETIILPVTPTGATGCTVNLGTSGYGAGVHNIDIIYSL